MRTSINEDKCPEFFTSRVSIFVIGRAVASGRARMESSGHFGVDSNILLFICASCTMVCGAVRDILFLD